MIVFSNMRLFPKIPALVLCHEASRTGAPAQLRDALAFWNRNGGFEYHILCRAGGPLVDEFLTLGQVEVLEPNQFLGLDWGTDTVSHPRMLADRNVAKLESTLADLRSHARGVVISNTMTNGDALEFFSSLGWPVVTYVQELNYCLRNVLPADLLARSICHTDLFLSVSAAVTRCLESLGVSSAKIIEISSFLNLANLSTARLQTPVDLRSELALAPDSYLIGACGTTDWRKGVDLFLLLARTILSRNTRCHFVWIGGETSGKHFERLKHDLDRAGLVNHVHFLGECPSAIPYLKELDVFALTSREDPCPIVFLEAAALRCPTVCFEGSGGAPLLPIGQKVPYLDIPAMAESILAMLDDKQLRVSLGDAAAQYVERNHSVEFICAQSEEAIRSLYSHRWASF